MRCGHRLPQPPGQILAAAVTGRRWVLRNAFRLVGGTVQPDVEMGIMTMPGPDQPQP
jgi:hypothetical protein